ncbi:hypothetical protein V7S43_015658 [Phytophthora oleae]|uniref:Secreted protein n=1 Tax=Phytophthora oleae TaxID=2107226 RepID=A0ABD3EXV5_9STRA
MVAPSRPLSFEPLRTHIRVALLFCAFVALDNAAPLHCQRDVKSCQAVGVIARRLRMAICCHYCRAMRKKSCSLHGIGGAFQVMRRCLGCGWWRRRITHEQARPNKLTSETMAAKPKTRVSM